MATSVITPLTFTGTSEYASSFQSVLTRSVGIASIPLQQLENQDQTVLSEETQLASLQGTAAGLTAAVKSLGDLGANQAISATSSNPANVVVTATGASAPALYTINSITSLASAASETSLKGYGNSTSTPVSTTLSMSLVVGTQKIPITLTTSTNDLVGLENAINLAGAGVTATILTTGNGNYLSVSAENQGATTLQIIDDPLGAATNILTDTNQGTNAVFTLNNLPVTRTSNTVNDLIPGATLSLQAQTASATTLTLASDPTRLTSGLQTLVGAYNAAVTQINGQAGTTTGVLSGDSIVYQLEGDMQQLSTFHGSGNIKSLADLGVTFNSNGTMSFDPTVVGGFSSSQLAGAFQFLGSETTGLGGVSQALDQVSNATTGAIAAEQTALRQDDASMQTQITNTETKINSMQRTLFQQLSQADTLISTLQSQQSILTGSIQSLDYTLYGTNTGTNRSSGG